MLPIVEQFDPLPREQILAIRPGTWGDFELLDVLKYFETERKDRDRAMAVAELILRSPQVSGVDYGWLCAFRRARHHTIPAAHCSIARWWYV